MAEANSSRGMEDTTDDDQRVKRAVARALEKQLPTIVARLAWRTMAAREGESKYHSYNFSLRG